MPNITAAVPVIATADGTATVDDFEETPGFKQPWIWGPPVADLRAGEPKWLSLESCHVLIARVARAPS